VDTKETQNKKVGFGLGLAILLMPLFFSWFLLRKGFSVKAKVIGFTWAFFSLIAIAPYFMETTPSKSKAIANISEFEIISFDKNDVAKKCTYEIRLQNQITKSQITTIANLLNEKCSGMNNTFIGYYLNDMKVGSGAWATSHFTPKLTVNILGVTKDEEVLVKQRSKNSKNTIGKWIDKSVGGGIFILSKEKSNFKLTMNFSDGSSATSKLKLKNGKYSDPQNSFGEYFKIDKSGNFLMCDNDGCFKNLKSTK
jgi:hypothetical protein